MPDDRSLDLLAAFARDLARQAGAFLRDAFGRTLEMRLKGAINPVTQADLDSERLIVEAIRRTFPDHDVLTEEALSRDRRASHRWVIDPIDGTTNFARGYPMFAVSIALEREGEPVVGVVYAPVLDELYWGIAGRGAFGVHRGAQPRPLRVSAVDRLDRAFVVTGFPYSLRERPEPVLRPLERMLLSTFALRRDGTAALNLCHVAAGVFDAFWEIELKPWDTTAALVLLREAGATVTDMTGAPYRPELPTIAASNGHLHAELLRVLAGAGAGAGGAGATGERGGL
ncbi:MAG TPA: inositol monophosphatase family protein [Thermodesulfobacteriota bacterium]|nr:inositol monophosphatase family protein [Thermodesulfobacteriota bacterium]